MTVDPGVTVPVLDVDLIAAAIATCPDVAALHGGRFGEIGTYLPGRRVRGIRITVTAVEVHVVGRFPATMLDIAAQVRTAVAPWAAGRPVDVTIEDLVVGSAPFEEPLVPAVDLAPPVSAPLPSTLPDDPPEQAEPPAVVVEPVGTDTPEPAVEVHVNAGEAAPTVVTVAVPTDPDTAAVVTVDTSSPSNGTDPEPKESSL